VIARPLPSLPTTRVIWAAAPYVLLDGTDHLVLGALGVLDGVPVDVQDEAEGGVLACR
jgi:hypothetical protein